MKKLKLFATVLAATSIVLLSTACGSAPKVDPAVATTIKAGAFCSIDSVDTDRKIRGKKLVLEEGVHNLGVSYSNYFLKRSTTLDGVHINYFLEAGREYTLEYIIDGGYVHFYVIDNKLNTLAGTEKMDEKLLAFSPILKWTSFVLDPTANGKKVSLYPCTDGAFGSSIPYEFTDGLRYVHGKGLGKEEGFVTTIINPETMTAKVYLLKDKKDGPKTKEEFLALDLESAATTKWELRLVLETLPFKKIVQFTEVTEDGTIKKNFTIR